MDPHSICIVYIAKIIKFIEDCPEEEKRGFTIDYIKRLLKVDGSHIFTGTGIMLGSIKYHLETNLWETPKKIVEDFESTYLKNMKCLEEINKT